MGNNRWIVVIRSAIAALLAGIGVVNLTSGRVVLGLLFLGLAAMNVALTLAVHRRRAELGERFPRLAEARRRDRAA